MVAKTIGFLMGALLPLYLARRMDQTQVGLYRQAFLVVASALQILPLGFSMNSYFFLPREPHRRASVVGNIVYFNLFVGGAAAVVLLIYPKILMLILAAPALVDEGPWIGLMILLMLTGASLEIIPLANNEMKFASVVFVFLNLMKTAFLLSAAWWTGNVHGMVLAGIAYGAAACVAQWMYLHARFPGFLSSFDKELLRKQLSYSAPLGLVYILYIVQTDLHNYVVSNRFGAAMFAVYSFGTTDLPLITILQESVNSVLIPAVGALEQQGRHRETILLLARAMRKMAALFFPLCAFLLVTGREFIRFLFTDRYAASWPIFAVNLAMLPLAIVMIDSLYRVYPSQRFMLIRVRLAAAVLLAAALWFGTQWFGMVGAIAAVVVVSGGERLFTAFRFARMLEITRKDIVFLKDHGKLALASIAAGVTAAVVRMPLVGNRPLVVLAVCGTAFTLVYAAAVLLLGVPSEDEKNYVLRKLRLARV